MKPAFRKIFYAFAFLFIFSQSSTTAQTKTDAGNLIYKYEAINKHHQIYNNSCIPSGVEMVLKLNKKVSSDFYNYQKIWGDKTDGNFANFAGLSIQGLRFYQKFNLERNDDFPINDLFKTIDKELLAKRYVLISLTNGIGWHIYVICSKLKNGEFVAYSKNGNQNMLEINVKQIIKQMKGTDILVYRKE